MVQNRSEFRSSLFGSAQPEIGYPLLNRWIPQPRVLDPYPDARFAATHSA